MQLITSKSFSISGKLILTAIILALLTLAIPFYYQPANQLKMEKDSGRNGKHANPKARESAEQEYLKAKIEFEQWDKKPNKTPDDKEHIKKLRRLLDKLKKKKDFSGENHSQKHKGR